MKMVAPRNAFPFGGIANNGDSPRILATKTESKGPADHAIPRSKPVGPVTSPGERTIAAKRVTAPNGKSRATDAGSGDPVYNRAPCAKSVGPVPPPGGCTIAADAVVNRGGNHGRGYRLA
jgi:hypothetical protein